MKWMTSLVLMAAVGGANLQCFSPNDNFKATSHSDLSGVTDFALDLYRQMSPQSAGNFFLSPYSIWSALTLAYFGSSGNTQRQLEATLRVSDKVSTINLWRSLGQLYKDRQQNATYTFDIANRIYFAEGFQLRPCVSHLVPSEVRFFNPINVTGSVNDINTFVADATRGRISKIVGAPDIMRSLMILVNAAYFKGTWKTPFETSMTRPENFFTSPQNFSPVPMMHQEGEFRYGESVELGARILELPYAGEAISMYVLLPNSNAPEETRFTDMVSRLNGPTLREAISPRNTRTTDIDVQLPKFKFEKKFDTELKTALEALGIRDLFSSEADLTAFTPANNIGVSKIMHKAFVEVNEEGTEAAAATVLIVVLTSLPKVPIQFHCNEPFVYFIYDKETDNILFLGSFKDPKDL